MPYVSRSANGEIASLHRSPTTEAGEFVDASAPEVQRFLGGGRGDSGFDQLDADFIRVAEDLIDVLVGKGLLRITDLPLAVQAKLVFRKDRREQCATGGQTLSPSSGFVEIIDDSAFGQLGAWEPGRE